MFGVDLFEIARERARRHSQLPKHEASESAMPSFQSQPTAGTTDAIAHHVDVHVDPHGELIAFAEAKVHPRTVDGAKPIRGRKRFLAESYRLVGCPYPGDFSSAADLARRIRVFLCGDTRAESA